MLHSIASYRTVTTVSLVLGQALIPTHRNCGHELTLVTEISKLKFPVTEWTYWDQTWFVLEHDPVITTSAYMTPRL
jgi:hypothetical protein